MDFHQYPVSRHYACVNLHVTSSYLWQSQSDELLDSGLGVSSITLLTHRPAAHVSRRIRQEIHVHRQRGIGISACDSYKISVLPWPAPTLGYLIHLVYSVIRHRLIVQGVKEDAESAVGIIHDPLDVGLGSATPEFVLTGRFDCLTLTSSADRVS